MNTVLDFRKNNLNLYFIKKAWKYSVNSKKNVNGIPLPVKPMLVRILLPEGIGGVNYKTYRHEKFEPYYKYLPIKLNNIFIDDDGSVKTY